MQYKSITPKTRMYANIDSELWKIVKLKNWDFSELLTFAIGMKLAENDDGDYPDCKLLQKVHILTSKLGEVTAQLHEYKEHFSKAMEEIRNKKAEEEIKNAIGE